MSDSSEWELGVEGNFAIHKAVVEGRDALHGHRSAQIDTEFIVMARGTKIVSAESCGISAWTKTAKICVILPDGKRKRYFLKVDSISSG